jgi:predicted phage replisome organizer
MTEIQWIKLRIDMFDDEKIKLIQAMPDGDALLVVWIRLIALAGKCNANGLILLDDEFPYTDEMLAIIFNKPLQTVRLALKTFEQFRMLECTTKGIYVTNFEKHQNVDGMNRIREQDRLRKQRERERKRAALLEDSLYSSDDYGTESELEEEFTERQNPVAGDADPARETDGMSRKVPEMSQKETGMSQDAASMSCGMLHDVKNMSQCVKSMSHDVKSVSQDVKSVPNGIKSVLNGMSQDVTNMSRDMSRDVTQQNKNKNKSKNINIYSSEYILSDSPFEPDSDSPKERIMYQRIMDDYNNTCTDLPSIRAVPEERRRKIRILMNGMDKDKIMPEKSVYERMHVIFRMARDSDFLSGRNNRWHGCSFDWLINKTNALKVLEGTYANKGGADNERNGTGNVDSAGCREVEGTTNEALERFRRNSAKALV